MTNVMRNMRPNLPLLWRSCGNWKVTERARREEAQSLVELALVVPLFLLLLLGSAEFARFAWASVLTSNAARAGASFGSLSVITAGRTADIKAAAAADSVNLSGLVTTVSTPCKCSDGTPLPQDCSNSASLCPATVLNYVQVNTSVQLPWGIIRGLGPGFTVTGQSTMVIEQ
jgi:Flp pilus assembly protein TadG